MDSALDILDLDELVILANLDLETNNLSDALVKLKLAHRKGGKGDLLPMLARLYARLGLYEKAKPLFSEYLQENPDALIEQFQYGMTFFDSNQLDDAHTVFESILDKEPSHPPAMFYSSLILSRQKKIDDATKKLENILATVDKENLFYQRAREQLVELHPNRAGEFSEASKETNNPAGDMLLN
jgi:tetratricopeptide (TPR) repeat protein